jgi:hypothetical protein
MRRKNLTSPRSQVQILFYSGYKGRETPRQIVLDGRAYPVIRVLSRERICDSFTGHIQDIFCLQLKRRVVTVRVDSAGKGELCTDRKRDR